jgi:6-phosphogluconolactonase
MGPVAPGELVTEKDAAGAARDAAIRMGSAIQQAVAARGRATIALSGGNSPRDAYATLARTPGIDWSKVDVFWVDERAVVPTDDRSNYRWAKATLLDPAPVPAERTHRMPADAQDLEAASRAYAKAIDERVEHDADGVPAFDVMVLGVGDDGHTASLFPGEATVDLTDRWVASVPARTGREARMTLTRPLLQHARLVLVLVVGAAKRQALGRAWAADGDLHATPSRVIREAKGHVTWIVDQAAQPS